MGDTISQGMKDEIGLATFLQLPILYVSDDMVKNQKMIASRIALWTSMTASPIVASTTTKINFWFSNLG